MKNIKNIIIIILILIILGLICYLIFDKVLNNDTSNENTNKQNVIKEENKEEIEQIVKYKTYKLFDEVELIDGSKWIVIKNSDEKTDYVTLLATLDYTPTNEYRFEDYDNLSNAIYESKDKNYSTSFINQYVNSIFSDSSLKLKEVDGYKTRLITLDEILNMDNNWEYNNTNDSYTYKGTNENLKYLNGVITMTSTKCAEGKCMPFYNVSFNSYTNQTSIEHWVSGISIKPVINVYKTEILVK